MSMQALQGIKVLDLTQHIAGPYGTKMLADYGADVIKVERPNGGDMARRLGPFPDDVPHPEKSGLFLHLNTNKRGITLNLSENTGRGIFLDLVKQADAVIENFAPRTLPALDLSYEMLKASNPDVVLVSISNFGQTGPYRDYKASEIVLHGMGGPMRSRGKPDREPVKYGADVALRQAGLVAATATMVTLFGGQGKHVDISIYETQAGSQDSRTVQVLTSQFVNDTFPRRSPGSAIASGTFPCRDGYINVTGGGPRFQRIVVMLDMPEILDDPRFATPASRADPANAEAFNTEILLPWLMQRTMREAWDLAQAAHVLSGPIYTAADLVADDHFRDRGMWVDVDHPEAGTVTMPGRTMIMSETPWQLRRPAPTLGQHNAEVYGDELGFSSQKLAQLRTSGTI